MGTTDDDLRSRATSAFKRYMNVWEFPDFWKRANTFDAALHFVTAVRVRWPDEAMSGIDEMIAKNKVFFDKYASNPDVWQDDYGWWGAAAVSAHDYCKRFGSSADADDYLKIARDSWHNMFQYGWDAVSGTNAAKPVPHGSRNRDRNPNNPGTKNTVTNATFLRLSVLLYSLTSEQVFLDMARQQYRWFEAWFEMSKLGYLQPPSFGAGVLIQERPMSKPDYDRESDPTWEQGWVWTGDQGLMLAALPEYSRIVPDTGPGPMDIFWRIGQGVQSILFDSSNVLQEAPFHSSFDEAFATDYVGGRGVLMRHLASHAVRKSFDFEQKIVATADAAWQSCDAANQFAQDWNPAGKAAFAKSYENRMFWSDGALDWQFDPKTIAGVLQGAGLDALGAQIVMTKPA